MRRPHPKRRRRASTRERAASGPLDAVVRLYSAGRLSEAIDACRKVVSQNPDKAEPAHLLGILLARSGDEDAAEQALRAAVRINPGRAAAWSDLGNVCSDQGRLEEAATAYRCAIERDPEYAVAYNNLAIVYRSQGRVDEALDAFHRAVELGPNDADALQNLGLLLKKLERFQEAAETLRRVLELEPTRAEAHNALYGTLRAAGWQDEANAALSEWLRHHPEDPVARHMMAASVGGDQTPPRASDEYVQEVFDKFADTFDQDLVHLHYRGPELMAEVFAKHLGPPRGDLKILDAGCGTGLCGPVLRPYAWTLAGVDLSAQMLEKAREKGQFDQLETAELTDYLRKHPGAWDVIVACDTFNYFGQLEPLFAAASSALRPHGRLIFTLERETDEPATAGYQLHSTGRYRHRPDYVEQALAAANLVVRMSTIAILRTEAEQPVHSSLFIVERTS